MEIEVTSVSRTSEPAHHAPAAVHVITGDDIRRSGVTSIAEALRLAPGVQVGRITANQWAISIRGFNDVFATKLLVLMDGRSVYTPTFSGTYWDVQDTLLEDIDRIEVIRGPGATMWGSNAVNGVVNIITKSAKDTRGGLVTAAAGNEDNALAAVRYGTKVGQRDLYIRGYLSYSDRDDQALSHGRDAFDEWRMARGGVRLDWDLSADDALVVDGGLYAGQVGEGVPTPMLAPPYQRRRLYDSDVRGGHLLSRWTRTLSEKSDIQLQLYYDRTDREKSGLGEARDTLDVDFDYNFSIGDRHHVVCGAGYRVTRDDFDNTFVLTFDPAQRTSHLVSAFAQDEITLLKDRLFLSLGTKLEHNDFTGLEVQPGARLTWTPHKQHTVWASVARAVRTPSRGSDDLRINAVVLPPGTLGPGSPLAIIRADGDKDVRSEELLAWELGYRAQPHSRVSFDLAGFYNHYDHAGSNEPADPFLEATPAPAHMVFSTIRGNKQAAGSYGGEAVVTGQLQSWWRVQAQYSYLHMHIESHSLNPTPVRRHGGVDPRNQFALRSMMTLPHNVELDVGLRYVDSLFALDVPHYLEGDVRVGWRPLKRLDLSLIGRNLFDSQHPEFRQSQGETLETETQRSFMLKATWKF